ncbi:MAG: MaoC family dehydratase N-terminal domain-containing protein [Dehalococcoidia bacterium]|nr:MaoC family dehydratase N-terminal domain-containing protein [Dehalococcoidia bacterium]
MTQQQASVITDEMRALIGKESEAVTYEVDNTGCRQFARAVGSTDPVFFDAEYARGKGYRGLPASAGFLGHAVVIPGQPVRVAEIFRLDVPLKRILNGGTDIEYFDDVCAGDVLSATSRLTDLSEREGRMGMMLIVQTETAFKNPQGKTVAIMRGTAIRY